MNNHDQYVVWNNYDGSRQELRIEGRETLEQTIKVAIEHATAFGWTPPKWWQWWRWNDTRLR